MPDLPSFKSDDEYFAHYERTHVMNFGDGDATDVKAGSGSEAKSVSPIEAALKSLQSASDYGEYYARNIDERLAKAWSNGEHRPTMRQLKAGENYTSGEINAFQNAATGVTIQGGLDAFESCIGLLKSFNEGFSSTPDKAAAKNIYDAYDDALDEYWAFIKRVTAGLNKDGVRLYLGSQYKSLFEQHIKEFKAPGEKIIEVIGPLLDTKTPHAKERSIYDMSPNLTYMNKPQTPEKLRSWTDTTNQYLKEGLAAATG